MKILITTALFTTDTNGVVTSVKNLWDELKKKGHDVRIITLSESRHSHSDGVVYYIRSMPIGVYPNVRMALSYRHPLIKELIEWRPDVIHSQCEFFTYQYALRIAKHTGAPIVHTYHTLYEQYVTYAIPSKRLGCYVVRVLTRKRLKKADRIIAPTHKVEQALNDYGLTQAISIVPSGINLDQHRVRITAKERAQKRRALGIGDEHFALLNLGRLGTEKSLDALLELFARAAATEDKLRFLIVGDGPARESLEQQAASLGVTDKVIFTGMVRPGEVQEYYQLGDVFVSASTSETQGLTYIEAAANGLPLLCRRDPCLAGVIRQGENGFEYDSEAEFLAYVRQICHDPEWCKAAGRTSEEIAATFDKSTFGDAVEKIYTNVLR
ncbi:MAG: glycosyltransferase [Clostridia bacterium]|nr:glycosyltransferase [Clostridia bacterium]